MPENLSFHNVTLQVKTEGEEDLSDNTQEIAIGYADISLGDIHISGNSEEAFLEGTIDNIGYSPADNIQISLYYDGEQTAFITEEVGTLAVGEQNSWKITIPKKYMSVNPLASGNLIRVEVTSDTDELNYVNNEGQYLILPEAERKISLNASALTLKVGESAVLNVSYSDDNVSSDNIEWGSSNEEVACVSDGEVIAVGAGTTVITASVGGFSATCEITVSDVEKESVMVILDATSINLLLGESVKLNADVLPSSAVSPEFVWKSDDSSVASVSDDGRVTAVGVGETIITVAEKEGYHSATCKVVVAQKTQETYTVSFTGGSGTTGVGPEIITGQPGKVVILPDNTFEKEGMSFAGWNDGEHTYHAGDAYRMPYHDVTFTAQWNEEGTIEYAISASAGENGTITPNGNVLVKEGTNQTFTIIPEQGYQVDSLVVDGKDIGPVNNYTFSDVMENHTIYASFKMVEEEKVYVESINLNKKAVNVSVGETVVLSADVLPHNATDTTLEWSSSDENIAIVDQFGLVTALGCGEAEITAKAQDGSGVASSCLITVAKADQKIIGTTAYRKVYGNVPFNLGARLTEGNGTLKYTSSNPLVVVVDNSGNVTIKGTGTAVITVTASETESYKKASLDIKIEVIPASQQGNNQKPSDINPPQGNISTSVQMPVIGMVMIDAVSGAGYRITNAGIRTGDTLTGAEVALVSVPANVKQFVIPNVITINGVQYKITSVVENAFKNKKKLSKVKIGENVTNIVANAFSGCKKLKSVTIGNNVTAIGNNAFKKCTSLKKVIIPARVTTIGKNAFSGCKKLKNVIVKTKVLKKIGKNAFKGINKAAKIKVPKKKLTAYKKFFKKARLAKSIKITR